MPTPLGPPTAEYRPARSKPAPGFVAVLVVTPRSNTEPAVRIWTTTRGLPEAVPTAMPEKLPVETVPVEVMLLMLVLLITPVVVPAGAVRSSGAVKEPDKVPMLTPLVVPWPAAVMNEPEAAVPTDMPEMLPV